MTSVFRKTTEIYVPGATTLPAEYYNSPEVFAEERERIFSRWWLCVGRAEQLPEPGDYLLAAVGRDSVIVLRDQQGTLRAFWNNCRHRGTRLCEAAAGRFSETIQCPYHAWTWRTDGTLIGAPHMQEAAGFDKRDYPLRAVALREWEGFLMMSLADDPMPFEEAFAPLLGRFARFRLGELRVVRRITYEVEANWKLIFQNYNECLHCPMIHPELSARLPYLSGANDLVEGPFLGGYMHIAKEGGSATMSGDRCAAPVGPMSEEELSRAYYYSLFPNLLLSPHPDYAMFHTLWPRDELHTRVVCEWMFHPDSFGRPEFAPDDAIEFWDRTNRQDWRISELTHAGIKSRGYVPGPYSPRESVPAAWDRSYLEVMGREG